MATTSFEHQIAYIAVRITSLSSDKSHTSVGTGFLFASPLNGTDRNLVLLISNKHVFIDLNGSITLSFNRKLPDGNPDYGNIITFEINNISNVYYPHENEDVDLACINVSAIALPIAYFKFLNNEFLRPVNYEQVAPGTEVLFVGYPANRYDVVNNLPLIRKGSIASVPEVDFNGRGQIVIDAQVFQGSSGSPVFVADGVNYTLLGVVSETMIRHSQLQTLPANLPSFGVEQILGLGIVVKQRHIQELIDSTVRKFILDHA